MSGSTAYHVSPTLRVKATMGIYHRDERDKNDMMQWIETESANTLVSLGEDYGYFIRPESAHHEWLESTTEVLQWHCHTTWSPDPSLGCEFYGGPEDGQLVALPTHGNGKSSRAPMMTHSALGFPHANSYASIDEEPVIPESVFYTYDLVGVNPETDRWVYRYRA